MARHLQREERIKIETLLEVGNSIDEIAEHLGRHRSTIYREMSRAGVKEEGYRAEIYHRRARKNMVRKMEREPSKEVMKIIEEKILNEQWSPEQISNWLKISGYETVSHTWIYRYIEKDKVEGGELFNNLRRGNYTKGHKPYKGHIVNRVSIEERPSEANNRERLGDYEVDLIVGIKNKGAILTIVDRKSRYCMLEKLTGKTSNETADKMVKAINTKAKFAFTITSDNGSEFSNHVEVARKLGIKYYFAHPYASYERGSIENLNGLIRQYLPKGTDLESIPSETIKDIETKLNKRPRKVLDFLSPLQYSKTVNVSHL